MNSLFRFIVVITILTPFLWAAEDNPAGAPRGDKPAVAKAVRNVGVDEFDKLRSDKGNIVLDVRTPREFATSHIPGAINIDYNAPDFAQKVNELDKSKTYLVHCAGGVRSAKACQIMDKGAFAHLVNLEPGFKAWEKAGKPVVKGEEKK
jgi:rhodanese-related sulfurtransferase